MFGSVHCRSTIFIYYLYRTDEVRSYSLPRWLQAKVSQKKECKYHHHHHDHVGLIIVGRRNHTWKLKRW